MLFRLKEVFLSGRNSSVVHVDFVGFYVMKNITFGFHVLRCAALIYCKDENRVIYIYASSETNHLGVITDKTDHVLTDTM